MIVAAVVGLSACAQREEAAPVKKVYTGKSILDYERATLSSTSYRVEPGDTLYSIAFRADQDVRTLANYNQLTKPYTIYPGQVLVLQHSVTKPAQPLEQDTNKRYLKKERNKKVAQSDAKQPSVTPMPRSRIETFPDSNAIRWQWPVRSKVIREFSTAEAGNKGLDFAGQRNDPVYAAAAGKVVYAGNALKGYGNLIIMKHNDDYITAYAHNQQLLVKEQQWVNAGDEIARMGDTDAEQVKLHFEVRFRGKSVNPRHYLPRGTQ
ncbi:peptidoglycan DD-metalloendopeptidase family protein [Pseudidiomarina salinarum]|uniref:peptidoglycan DD-metalloendopeptidase family protein n=1 Tax=Pseudidiomarina salinarum TaxID=435908 RepID=UPI000AC832BD|nr:peptidoglycan DD-metalloendopeptidase family protein [Pseudidiomarina salinarum]